MFNYGNALIADTTLAIFSLFILKKYFEIFFIKKDRKIVGCFCWALYFIWQLIIGSINILPAYINVIISIILVSLVCIGEFEGNILQKFVFSVLINAIWMLAEFLVGYGFVLCGIDYMIPQFWGSLLSKLVALILIVCLQKFFHDENIKNLPNKYNFILLLIPIGSMFVVYNIFMLSIEINQRLSLTAC